MNNKVNYVLLVPLQILIAITLIVGSCMSEQTSFLPLALASQVQQTNSGLYDNSTYGISFEYPFGWNKVEILAGPITNIKYVLPSYSSISNPPTIDIVIDRSVGNSLGIEEYREFQEQNFKSIFGDSHPFTNQQIVLSGLPAYKMAFLIDRGDVSVAAEQVFTVKGGKVYLITYSAEILEFLLYLPEYNRLIESFTIN